MGFSFNNPLIIGDINKETKELKQEIGDLSQLDTADKSSLVNALNEAIDSTLNGVNNDLTNLSDIGEEKLRSLNAYSNNGELLTDSEGLEDVKSYAHSTFCGYQPSNASPLDPKKFTYPAGHRPNITDDGIASGFSSSNYLTLNTLDLTKPFKITSRFTVGTVASTSEMLVGNTNSAALKLEASNFRFYYNSSYYVGFTVTSNTTYDIIAEYDGNTTIKLHYKTFGQNEYSVEQNTSVVQSSNTAYQLYISKWWTTPAQPWLGSIDLKQFSITVDGVEVFSGNKTGIDTVKPDNFEAPSGGSLPTISAAGIASGFGNDVCIEKSLDFSSANTWEVQIPFTTADSLVNDSKRVFDRNTASVSNLILVQVLNNLCRFSLTVNGSGIWSADDTNFAITANTNYVVKIGYDGTQYYCKYSINGGQFTNVKTITSNAKWSGAQAHYIGYGAVANQYFNGSIDLNAFKIYVDGDLVYQPCLKIPYTESKTGSKIVDAVYRDRVNDMAEQFGYAPYYTLSDTDFTLPQVELYGNIQQTLRSSTKSTTNRKYLYSDRTQILTGTCTSGIEVTLNTPFADANYVLTVPYSAKSATAFTPTATGDWIALGEGVL